jgi:hypothetical protein
MEFPGDIFKRLCIQYVRRQPFSAFGGCIPMILYRWAQNRDWFPTHALYSSEFSNRKGAWPRFDVLIYALAFYSKQSAPESRIISGKERPQSAPRPAASLQPGLAERLCLRPEVTVSCFERFCLVVSRTINTTLSSAIHAHVVLS